MENEDIVLRRVDAALKSHPHLRRVVIQSARREDRVVLSGNVDSFFIAQMAQEAVRDVDGVREIENRMEIAWPLY